jgi:Na+/phosphate symporter
VREYVGRVRLAYILSIVVSVLLIAGIALIYRNVKGSTRTLGIVFLASGLVLLVLALIGKNVGGEQMLQAMVGTPQQLQVWASQVLVDLLAPLQWLGVGFMAGGVGLLVASFVYKPSQIMD